MNSCPKCNKSPNLITLQYQPVHTFFFVINATLTNELLLALSPSLSPLSLSIFLRTGSASLPVDVSVFHR